MAHTDASKDTFAKYLLLNAERFRDRPSMRFKDYGIWQSWTWAEQLEEVRAFALGLQKIGLKRGDKIAVIGSNRPRLYWTFAAAQSLGAVPVPVYADSVAEEMAYVLNHAEVTFAVVEDQEQVDKVLSISDEVPLLTEIVYDEERGLRDYDHTHLHAYDSVRETGMRRFAGEPEANAGWLAEIGKGRGDDLSVILYTSGTTGRPKGVMLSNDNFVRSAINGNAFDNLTENETIIAYLPLAWVGDHLFSYAQSYTAGFCVACPESPETVNEDRREIAPTYFFAPPRVFEAMLTSIMVRMEDAGKLKKGMFDYFLAHAAKVGERILNGEQVGFVDRLKYRLGEFMVYGPLKNRMGFSNMRVGYTAGEAIGPELFSFYRSLGLNLKQLYGQTEATVYITAQEDGKIRPDTVGLPSPEVEIRIAESGEVMYRSPGVFVGYYKNDEATRETKTEDGWVHTGDAGFFDTDGQLKIIDRAKDVGKLASGALFAPKYIENTLKFFPDIQEAVAFGHGREFCAAFINIDLQAVGNWAERNNIAYASYQELAGHPRVYETIAAHVNEANRRLAREPLMAASQVKRFLVLHKELDADDGELTRTQKVRRKFIAERYGELIEALYDGSTEKFVETQVTYEDGRKGVIRATVKIVDAEIHEVPAENVREAAE
ncbi:AMP-binding protein [Nitratireductor aquimarinus]|uniref:AMP-binding protein n=1 Tax=Nitratireductor TaxID=245876 RepID=UPI0019D3BA90|nr:MULTISPECIES: AMP-binding protein [Nitratireductor]MBN7775284.1 AMP-binding protein [Nitratireductor pacificus]MBN7781298.1 AMP-binding protein [Nitratireductor pacificus]MBN7790104.1 AMP-binding protein [Nitratireductor aquimarinus]MBY6097671.1 AMP-binding protein [Nitratireductor aquimarinus]MCA1261241.1 AMP-binding protein [Nitratireductor aquimarinus]